MKRSKKITAPLLSYAPKAFVGCSTTARTTIAAIALRSAEIVGLTIYDCLILSRVSFARPAATVVLTFGPIGTGTNQARL